MVLIIVPDYEQDDLGTAHVQTAKYLQYLK